MWGRGGPMADDGTSGTTAATGPDAVAPEDAALQEALAAAHTAIWGYGVVGAALPAESRPAVVAAEQAHRDVRDQLLELLSGRGVRPVAAAGAYALPFPVLSATDAAALAGTPQDGAPPAWAGGVGPAPQRTTPQPAGAPPTPAGNRAGGRGPPGRPPPA